MKEGHCELLLLLPLPSDLVFPLRILLVDVVGSNSLLIPSIGKLSIGTICSLLGKISPAAEIAESMFEVL